VLATDSMWLWAFPGAKAQDRSATRADYHQLLAQLRGWLTHAPQYANIQIRAPDHGIGLQQHVTFAVRVRDSSGAPARSIQVKHRFRPVGGHLQQAPVPWSATAAPTDDEGRTSIHWRATSAGPQRLEVEASPGAVTSRDSIAVGVPQAGPEERQIRPDPGLLSRLARISAGKVWHDDLGGAMVPLARRDTPDRIENVRTEVWSQPWVAIVLLVLLVLEWLLRRRWGLA
jgi:hypothetical protein